MTTKDHSEANLKRAGIDVSKVGRGMPLPANYDPEVDPPLLVHKSPEGVRAEMADKQPLEIVHQLNTCCNTDIKASSVLAEHRCPGAYWAQLSKQWRVCTCACHEPKVKGA